MRGVLHLNFLQRRAVDWEAAGQRFNGVPSSRVAARVHCHQEAWVFSNFASKTVAASREHSRVSPALFVLFLFMFVCCCSLPITYSTALQGRSGCNRSLFLGLRVASGWGMGYYPRLSSNSGIHGAPLFISHRLVHSSFVSMSKASANT